MTYTISKEECEQFAILLNKGLDSRMLIELCFTHADCIIQDLEQGNSLHEIIAMHTKGMDTLKVFKYKLSLNQCFECIQSMHQSQKEFQDVLIKKGVYPFFIFLFAYSILFFFVQYIMPQMEAFLTSHSIVYFLEGLKIVFTLLFIANILFMLCLAYMFSNYKNQSIDHLVQSFPILIKIRSYQFAIVYKTLIQQGLSSYECFHLMRQMEEYPQIQTFVQSILNELESGKSLLDSLSQTKMDEKLIYFLKIGMNIQDVTKTLQLYCTYTQKNMEMTLKKVSMLQQSISYACVGILVVVVYQVLLLPLNMLYSM